MIGVLLVTHGQFCESMKESTEMVLGVQKNFYSLPLNPEDLFGGSPYNAAASCLKHAHMECVAGMNFPMILGILENRERVSLEDLPEIGKQSGIAGIINVRKKIASLC